MTAVAAPLPAAALPESAKTPAVATASPSAEMAAMRLPPALALPLVALAVRLLPQLAALVARTQSLGPHQQRQLRRDGDRQSCRSALCRPERLKINRFSGWF